MKKFLILFALLLPSLEIFAQKEKNPFTATLYGGIYLNNDQAWSIEPSIAWHFHKYMGVAFGNIINQADRPQ